MAIEGASDISFVVGAGELPPVGGEVLSDCGSGVVWRLEDSKRGIVGEHERERAIVIVL